MKKNFLKVMCLTMALACMPVPAMAATNSESVSAVETDAESVEPRADVIYYVHTTVNGVKMHRLWNETKGVWVGQWTECDCK